MNQKVILIVSIVVGLAAFGLSTRYFQKRAEALEAQRNAFLEQTRKINVVVAGRNIPQDVTLTADDLRRGNVYEIETRLRGDVVREEDAALLIGRKTLYTLREGEPFYWSDIQGGDRIGKGLAPTITTGMRAVSLSVGGADAVSSMIRPDDRIDVLGTFTFPSKQLAGEMETVTLTVLQDVSVLATGQRIANQTYHDARRGYDDSYNTVTLEVTPREAELLVFAQQLKGRITMTLRNPGDVSYESELPSVNFQALEDRLPELNLYRQRNIRHKTNL